jgi:hypothetical protein
VLRALSSSSGLTTNEAQVAWQERDVECCRRMMDEWRKTSSEVLAAIEARAGSTRSIVALSL